MSASSREATDLMILESQRPGLTEQDMRDWEAWQAQKWAEENQQQEQER